MFRLADGRCLRPRLAVGYPLQEPKAIARNANGTDFDRDLQQGAWYRGSQAHSMVSPRPLAFNVLAALRFDTRNAVFQVNFAAEGPSITPENETWRPPGAFGHQWGMRGAAWVDAHFFSDALDYVDLNVSRAVQASQLPQVEGYHRRVFANWADGSYLLWDVIDAPPKECAQATMNLHVLTQLGWPGKAGCETKPAQIATRVECAALNSLSLDVAIVRPSAADWGLLHIEADPLPIQVIPTPSRVLGPVFPVSPRWFQRAPSRKRRGKNRENAGEKLARLLHTF